MGKLLKYIPDKLLKNIHKKAENICKSLTREMERRISADYQKYTLDYFSDNPGTAILYNKTDLDYLTLWADNDAMKNGYDLNPFWEDSITYDEYNFARIKVYRSLHSYIIKDAEDYKKEIYFNPSLFANSGWEL